MPPLPPACRSALAPLLPSVRLPWPEASPPPGALRDDPLLSDVRRLVADVLEEATSDVNMVRVTLGLLVMAACAIAYFYHENARAAGSLLTDRLKRSRLETREKMLAHGKDAPGGGSAAGGGAAEEQRQRPSAQLPAVCPQSLRASAGARISVPAVPADAATWSADVAVEALCPDQRADHETGPATALLCAHLRWAPWEDRLARVVEIEERGQGGGVLASVSSELEVRLRDGSTFGRLRFVGRRRYVLEAADGRALMCLSSNVEATSMELGALPEGLLLATAEHLRSGDSMEVLAQPGVDVAFVLVCVLAIKQFAPPAKYDPTGGGER